MPPFQQWFVELISMVSSLLVGIAAIVGIAGLWRWRFETIGKARFEVARKLLLLALQFRDEFKSARNPFTLPSEWTERKKEEGESEKAARVLDEAFARGNRLERLRQTMLKMEEVGWEVEAILGDEAAALIKPFGKVYMDFQTAYSMYFHDQYEQSQENPIDHAFNRQMKEIVYGTKDDKLSESVDSAVDKLKIYLKRYIPK